MKWSEYRNIRVKWFGEDKFESRKNYLKFCDAKGYIPVHDTGGNSFVVYGGEKARLDFKDSKEYGELTNNRKDSQILFNYLWSNYHMESTTSNSFYENPCHTHSLSLADLPCAKVAACAVPAFQPKTNKGKKAMRYDQYDNPILDEAGEKRDYLSSRANSIYYTVQSNLEKAFGLRNDDAPTTPAELVKRIQDGMFVLSDDNKDKNDYEPARRITWRNPSVKKDRDGFNAAQELLNKKNTEVVDSIMVFDSKDALAAVQAFENWKPEGLPN